MRFWIDDQQLEAQTSSTILEAALSAGIKIPTLCHHPALESYGSCRLCTVEIEKNGKKRFVTACNYPIEDGLVVRTATPAVLDIRRMIAELLLSRCPKEKQIQDLAREYGVIEPRFKLEEEKCILCGLCCRVCGEMVGVFAINFQNRGTERSVGAPYGELSEDCIACGACSLVCPTSAISAQRNIFPLTAEDIIGIEEEHLSGERDVDLGVCSELFAARTEIQGQDGGVVTSLLARCLDKGVIDAAVVVYQKENNGGRAAAVDDIEGVIKAKGTKYVRVSALAPLIDALRGGKRRVAVVGTPCQIRVIRKLEQLDYFKDEFPDAEIFLVGLFCFESFDYRRLRDHAKGLLGIDIEDADKIQIAKGRYIATLDGMEHSCSVRELENDIREGCRFCGDLVSRLADISIGSVGSAEGYSSVIVRSEKGKKLLDWLSFCREKAVREDIVKLARMKRRNADRNLERIRKGVECSQSTKSP